MIDALAAMPYFFYTCVFVFSLCIGSFLNVVIYRLPIMLQREWQQEAKWILQQPDDNEQTTRFNLAFPASACPNCQQPIKAWQNIPVISYLMLRGKCAGCQQGISIRYPAVELLTGVLGVLLAIKFGVSTQFLALLLFTYVAIALTGIDYDTQLLPDNLVLPLLWLGLLLNTQSLFVSLQDAVVGAAIGYGFLWSVFWLFKIVTGKEGMGYGDFKLMAAFGAWFGWQVLPNIVLLSSLVGALFGISLMLWKKMDKDKPMPFGPFIIVAGWLTVIYPNYFVISLI